MKKFFVLFLVIFSCGKQEEKRYFEPSQDLIFNKFLKFSLDDQTGFFHSTIMFSDDEEKETFSFTNGTNNSLYYYDTSNSKKINRIPLDTEGENGVGYLENISSFYFENPNLIYLYNIAIGKLFTVNNKGEVISKIDLVDYKSNNFNV